MRMAKKSENYESDIRSNKEIIAEYENGVCVSVLASKYGMPKSTISTFLKNTEMIKADSVVKGSKVINKQRPTDNQGS